MNIEELEKILYLKENIGYNPKLSMFYYDNIYNFNKINNYPVSKLLPLQNYVITYQNKREYQEDRFLDFIDFDKCVKASVIFDGHGGPEVSEFLKLNFNSLIYKIIDIFEKNYCNFKKNKDKITEEINKEYLLFDKKLKKLNIGYKIGSTAILFIYFWNYTYILVSNLGDSRLIYYDNSNLLYITKDHKPEHKEESSRIRKTSFVVDNRIEGIINISRTFGDFKYKKNSNSSPIICQPNLKFIELKNKLNYNYFFTIIGSDGLFDVISNKLLTDYVLMMLINNTQHSTILKNLIIYASIYKKSKDNITISLIINGQFNTDEINNKNIEIYKNLIYKYNKITNLINKIKNVTTIKNFYENIEYYNKIYNKDILPFNFFLFSYQILVLDKVFF